MSLRDSRYWDRQLEEGLPDSRLSGMARARTTVVHAGKVYERVFCANCGADGGGVTEEWACHIFYVCDNCVRDNGEPPGAIKVENEAAVRGQPRNR